MQLPLPLIHRFWNLIPKKVRDSIYLEMLKILDRVKLNDLSQIYPVSYFEWHRRPEVLRDVEFIVKVLVDKFKPKSVVDFGCGIGSYLHYFSKFGVKCIHGYEGSPNAFKCLLVNPKYVERHDLRDGIKSTKRYDLCLCLEVIEHISSKFEDTILNSLCASGYTLCLACAPCNQGGTHHINEKPHEYWIKKICKKGFIFQEEVTEEIQKKLSKELKVKPWMARNIIIFQTNKSGTFLGES